LPALELVRRHITEHARECSEPQNSECNRAIKVPGRPVTYGGVADVGCLPGNGTAPVLIKFLASGVIEAGADPFYNCSPRVLDFPCPVAALRAIIHPNGGEDDQKNSRQGGNGSE